MREVSFLSSSLSSSSSSFVDGLAVTVGCSSSHNQRDRTLLCSTGRKTGTSLQPGCLLSAFLMVTSCHYTINRVRTSRGQFFSSRIGSQASFFSVPI